MFVETIDEDQLLDDKTNLMILSPPTLLNSLDDEEDSDPTETEIDHLIESLCLKMKEHRSNFNESTSVILCINDFVTDLQQQRQFEFDN